MKGLPGQCRTLNGQPDHAIGIEPTGRAPVKGNSGLGLVGTAGAQIGTDGKEQFLPLGNAKCIEVSLALLRKSSIDDGGDRQVLRVFRGLVRAGGFRNDGFGDYLQAQGIGESPRGDQTEQVQSRRGRYWYPDLKDHAVIGLHPFAQVGLRFLFLCFRGGLEFFDLQDGGGELPTFKPDGVGALQSFARDLEVKSCPLLTANGEMGEQLGLIDCFGLLGDQRSRQAQDRPNQSQEHGNVTLYTTVLTNTTPKDTIGERVQ